MANKTMKTLTIGSNTYEIVDEAARNDIEQLKNSEIPLDTTLTQSGQAADAKVVGDAINQKVPVTRTINGKALDENIILSAEDVNAAPSDHTHEVDNELSNISENPVQNKVVNEAISQLAVDIANAGSINIDLDDSNEGEANPINADTLGGVPASDYITRDEVGDFGGSDDISIDMEGVLEASPSGVNADTLGGYPASDYATKEQLNDDIVNRVIYGSGKNLLQVNAKDAIVNSVKFTVNSDGSINANGTNNITTAGTIFKLCDFTFKSSVMYLLSGGLSSYLQLDVRDSSNAIINNLYNTGGSLPILFETETTASIFIRIDNGFTADNVTFYPMIRLASESDDTYEPYYEGLKDLTDRGMELLWENASPTSEFGEQDILLNTEGASAAIVTARYDTTYATQTSWFVPFGFSQVIKAFAGASESYRSVGLYENRMWFSNARDVSNTSVNNNTKCIPTRIYLIKEGT